MSEALTENENPRSYGFPSTRYQGSKRKLLPALHRLFSDLPGDSCLDAFGGTGSVTHLLRSMGREVTYNDVLYGNEIIARALFSYATLSLQREDIADLFERHPGRQYRSHFQDVYQGIYYLDDENKQLDYAATNIRYLDQQAADEACYMLFQSMLSKRPYNLFHRANLNLRTRAVRRSFGNKVTWDRSFSDHMLKFYRELERYRRNARGPAVHIERSSIFSLSGSWDLVYLDPPYARQQRQGPDNYFNYYHLLDAFVQYDCLPDRVCHEYVHKPSYQPQQSWVPDGDVLEGFRKLFEQFYPATIVLSYRSDGFPSPEQLQELARRYYACVSVQDLSSYRYVLSSKNSTTKEIVLIARVG